jgi:hypothetical protein
VAFAYSFFTLLIAAATLGGPFNGIRIIFSQPQLKNGPENAQRYEAKQ